MNKFTLKKLSQLKNSFEGRNVAVVGDMMLDGYFWGAVKRISPEAPVPIVEVDDEFFRFGGAANVALNIIKLGGTPFPIGVLGTDNDAKTFMKLLQTNEIDAEGIFADSSRPTTVKVRVIAHNHHLVRIDRESKEYINEKLRKQLFAYLQFNINKFDAIILQDYNKGVLSPQFIKSIIQLANEKNKIITVDPKFDNFFSYKDVTVFKPNRKETEDALGLRINNDEQISKAGKILLQKLRSKYLLLTLGEKGISLFQNGVKEKRIQTKARNVADVSGAGDTVIATLTMALAAGAKIEEAAYLANFAGGLVCEESGIVPIELENLFNHIMNDIE